MLPAPRISRSRMAILNPAPRSVNSSMAFNRCLGRRPTTSLSGVDDQVRIGPEVGPPDAAAQLVQIREAVQLSASSMNMVFALGMSRPLSMMVVATQDIRLLPHEGFTIAALQLVRRPFARAR